MNRRPDIADLVRPDVRTMAAYHVPKPERVVAKLDANEFPEPLAPDEQRALLAHLESVDINRYPDASCAELRAAVAADLGVEASQLVFGNGSDEIIGLLMSTFSNPRQPGARAGILYPTPTFVWFRLAALGANVEPIEVPLSQTFELDMAALHSALSIRQPNVAFFARPNNPTGTLWPSAHIAELASSHPGTLFISDEAYAQYCGDSMVAYVDQLPNLAVMRTLSKIGLAALRVGFLYGPAPVTHELEKLRPPYNINSLSQVAATFLLREHGESIRQRCAAIAGERNRLAEQLAAIVGVHVFPSSANLILVRIGSPGDGGAGALWQQLADRGILVRNLDRPGPLGGCLRITVGTRDENDLLLTALAELIG